MTNYFIAPSDQTSVCLRCKSQMCFQFSRAGENIPSKYINYTLHHTIHVGLTCNGCCNVVKNTL